MRIAWITDPHLLFLSEEVQEQNANEISFLYGQGLKNDLSLLVAEKNAEILAHKINDRKVDCAIITGDISEFPQLEKIFETFNRIVTVPVYYVHGNHDAYHASFEKLYHLSNSHPFSKVIWAQKGIFKLSDKICLTGHDGFYDGRFGDFFGVRHGGWAMGGDNTFTMPDWTQIEEMAALKGNRELIYDFITRKGDDAAQHLKDVVRKAAQTYDTIIHITHVPPFQQCSRTDNGDVSPQNSLPFFSCKATTDALLDLVDEFPDKKIIVFAGHTHAQAALMLENIEVYVAGAIYYEPDVYCTVEIDEDGTVRF